ncbi:DUF1972 domain-containing protein [Enterobacter sichuanensis]|uniref:DUF1972 domain-containing protein n=1 Tax=Enterobacter sichuanensis TaxID=2071710 RepID=UPI00383B9E76
MKDKPCSKCSTGIIGTVGVPASYGGFETLVENIIENDQLRYVVYCSTKKYSQKKKKYKGAELVYIPLDANGVSSILYDIFSIIHAVFFKKVKNLLILGVSGCLILPFIKKISSVKICTNIDGLEWKRDKWSKNAKRFLKWSEKIAVRYSDVIIADNQEISNYVLEEYNKPCTVIAYGGDHAIADTPNLDMSGSENNSYALALCRIEPENNVHVILEAFVGVGKNLKFIGNWDNSEYGKKLKMKYRGFPNIELIDPIYDIAILDVIRRNCSVYIHGHSAGGTNPSLVEMMFFGKPIICFDCKYNRYTTHDMSDYFINSGDLNSKITNFVDNNEGVTLKRIAEENYTWDKIRRQYENLLN